MSSSGGQVRRECLGRSTDAVWTKVYIPRIAIPGPKQRVLLTLYCHWDPQLAFVESKFVCSEHPTLPSSLQRLVAQTHSFCTKDNILAALLAMDGCSPCGRRAGTEEESRELHPVQNLQCILNKVCMLSWHDSASRPQQPLGLSPKQHGHSQLLPVPHSKCEILARVRPRHSENHGGRDHRLCYHHDPTWGLSADKSWSVCY